MRAARILLQTTFLFGCLYLGAGCSINIHGEFGWSTQNNHGINRAEREFLQESTFRMGRRNLYFSSRNTIWWIYQINGGFYFADGFLAALYENNNTPQPVLVKLQKSSLIEDNGGDFIRSHYDGLRPGYYILRVAYDSKPVDEAAFVVFSSEKEDTLSLQTQENLQRESVFLTEEEPQENSDEIEYYSRNVFHRKYQ